MNFSHRPLRLSLASFACFSALVGCSSASTDPAGSSSSNQASTSPVTCPSGTIHPRVCTEPFSLPSGVDSGVDTTGDTARDVNNDVNAPCPDGYTGDKALQSGEAEAAKFT
jgi:hypothetical protein